MKKLSFRMPTQLTQGYGFPIVVSVLLHIAILGLLSYDWSEKSELKIPPQNIKASLVEVAQPKPAPPAVQPKPVVDDSARRAREQAEKKRQAEARKKAEAKRQRELALKKEREAKEKARKEEAARKEREKQRKLAEERKKAEERRKKAEAQRQLELDQQRRAQEAAAQAQADKDASEVAYYSSLLQNLIVQNWSRPPSARNNMVTTIQIKFSPFGELLEVRLLETSGNEAFDSSVIRAVRRAAPFPELKKLDRRIFDNNFKQITFRFRPEDLVR